jgi:hypothetical protein
MLQHRVAKGASVCLDPVGPVAIRHRLRNGVREDVVGDLTGERLFFDSQLNPTGDDGGR